MAWEPGKPSDSENEYFARQDAEWIKSRRAALDAERLKAESDEKKLKCPRCDGRLTEREISHVKVDVCDKCRGVWFDAGELEVLTHVSTWDLRRAVRSIDTGK